MQYTDNSLTICAEIYSKRKKKWRTVGCAHLEVFVKHFKSRRVKVTLMSTQAALPKEYAY